MNERQLFMSALQIEDPAARRAYLDQACAGAADLRQRVEDLLRAFEQAGSFLQQPAQADAAADGHRTLLSPNEESGEGPGATIGPYKLLEQIGEGGMGTVWMAQQTEPVKRLVAVKLIKAGMDSRQVIARFDAERQALALMDHTNIARVIEAGTTAAGRPYFVMDLVKGVPITKYCDEHHLTPQQRLELFIPVCHAVQHAHQKGIIHRDLKPSNVLVALYDGKPVPKIIDFGVAKAAGQPLTEQTLVTGFGNIVGTLEYMSPEQAELNQLDIDTRSDIYSLGVLLYELLTGSPPFSRKQLEQVSMLEMLRVIREQEPSKPSTKLSTAEGLPTLAANRGTEPARLTRLVRGELDWIVMKALEKDRARRYETANGFAMDIQRYLADEAVLACPPSAGYRFRKFARRNKATLATGAMVAATLVAGIIGTTWQAVRATHEADRASSAEALAGRRYTMEKSARTAEKLQRQIAVQQKNRAEAALSEVAEQKQRAQANFNKARRAVDEYLNKVTESELLSVPGLQPLREELLEAALRFYAEFTKERADDPTLQRELASAHYRLGRIHQELGNAEKSQKANAEAIRLYEQLREAGHFDQNMQVALGWAYFFARRHDDTMTLCQEVLLAEAGHAEARSLLAETCNALAVADSNKNDIESALKNHTQAFELREALVRDAPNNARYLAQLGSTLNNLGTIVSRQEKIEEAMAMFERAVEYSARAYQLAPHSVLWGGWLCIGLTNLASIQKGLGQQQGALASYERLVAVSQKRAFENPAVTSLRGDLSRAHLLLARYQQYLRKSAEATRSFRQAREVLENIPRETPDQLYELATVYAALAQPPEVVIDPDQEETAERRRHVELTLETLRNAVKAGYANAQTVKTNRLFDILRTRAEFQQLVTGLDKAAQAGQLASRNEGTDDQKLADRLRAAQLLNDLVAEQPGGGRHKSTLAATLQSIGVIQTRLKQFGEAEKSLRDAIVLWRELAEAQPDKQEFHISRIGSQISLGTLFHERGRSAQAHRTWQNCLAELEQLRARAPHDAALAVHLDWNVMQICDIYGSMGAFTFAAHVARSHLHFQRFRSWPELDLAIVLALFDGDDALREACHTADRERTAADGRGWSEGGLRNLGKVSNLLNPPALSPEQSLLWIERTARAAPDDLWHLSLLAFAQHRAGKSADALATFEKLTDSKDCSTVFAGALIAHGAGQRELARERLQKAEPIFVDYCRQTLQRSPVGLAPPLSQSGHWWELTGPVLLRREAWRLIDNGAVPDEAWLRLIEARADHLLGDVAARDEQLAAAADSSHIDVWLARARLAAELDQSPDAAWQRAVELAGSDPLPWIERGRWYTERGQQEKADADLARAIQLDARHPLCRLESARRQRTVIAAWDFSRGADGVRESVLCKLSAANGVLAIDSTGNDPIFATPQFKAGPGGKELTICARLHGTQSWQVFWRTTKSDWSEDRSVRFVLDASEGSWREYRVTFDPSPDLTGLRFDPPNEAGVHAELAWIMLADYSAEAELTRAVEQAPDNPLAWIERGRWHAERGEHEQADADFAKAASLTPNELNKFLEAGWWVVGPYSSNLKESCPPETDADPSRPVHVNPTEGLSSEPVKWQPAPTGRWGRVDLTSLAVRKDNSSVYCLAYVYSPGEQTKLLMIPRSQPLRVWINDTLVEDYAPGEYPVYPSFESFHRVPVVLRAGRNSLLVKTRMANFTVRIGDTPRDRAVLLMEQEQFTEALAMRTRMTVADRDAQSGAAPRALGELAVLLGTDEECSEASRSLIALAQHDSNVGKLDIAYYCAHRANPVFADHATTLVGYVDDFLSQPQPDWFLNFGALVHYRARNFERSRSLLDQSQSKPYEAPLQALLAHQDGDDVAARKFLDDALKLAAEHEGSLEQYNRATFVRPYFVWWLEWAGFLTMLREAEQAIRGETTKSDVLRARSEAIAKAKWTKSPETADFDHAILFGSIDSSGLPKFPQPYLARGRRLRELGRVDEAEADFKKAAELRPDEERQEAKEPQPPD